MMQNPVTKLKKDLAELRELQKEFYEQGVFAKLLMIYPRRSLDEGLTFFAQVGEDDDKYYMGKAFGNPYNLWQVEHNAEKAGAELIPLGEKGIPIGPDDYFERHKGEIYFVSKGKKTKLERLLKMKCFED